MAKSEKFVAELKIEKIERTTYDARPGDKTERVLDSVTKIIIKADTLDKLVEKLGKHIEIIAEE